MNNIIELKNIVKNYHKKKKIRVLNRLKFSFKAGKIYSLMGPSGSGKSTLLNLLSLIDIPTSGTIKIFNNWSLFNIYNNYCFYLPSHKGI